MMKRIWVTKKGKGKVSQPNKQKKKMKKRPHLVKNPGVASAKILGRPKNCVPCDLSQPTIMAMFKK